MQIHPYLETAQKRIAGLHQVWRHITAHTFLTQEAILEVGRNKLTCMIIGITIFQVAVCILLRILQDINLGILVN